MSSCPENEPSFKYWGLSKQTFAFHSCVHSEFVVDMLRYFSHVLVDVVKDNPRPYFAIAHELGASLDHDLFCVEGLEAVETHTIQVLAYLQDCIQGSVVEVLPGSVLARVGEKLLGRFVGTSQGEERGCRSYYEVQKRQIPGGGAGLVTLRREKV